MSARSSLNYPNPFTQAPINFIGAGDNIIVPAQAGKQIKVFRLKLICGGATALLFKDGTVIVLDGPLDFSANEGMVLDFTSMDMPPWYTTSPGNALIINSSLGVQVGGNLDYLVS
jgi:hypothetical protein